MRKLALYFLGLAGVGLVTSLAGGAAEEYLEVDEAPAPYRMLMLIGLGGLAYLATHEYTRKFAPTDAPKFLKPFI